MTHQYYSGLLCTPKHHKNLQIYTKFAIFWNTLYLVVLVKNEKTLMFDTHLLHKK